MTQPPPTPPPAPAFSSPSPLLPSLYQALYDRAASAPAPSWRIRSLWSWVPAPTRFEHLHLGRQPRDHLGLRRDLVALGADHLALLLQQLP